MGEETHAKRSMCIFLFLNLLYTAASDGDFLFQKKKYVVEKVEGVSGEAARLPCNMSVQAGDTVYLVLWFKEGLTTPIYSYDMRELLGGEPKHWWDQDLLSSRAYFNAGISPSHLLLQDLAEEDAGVYKCRVDFQRAPTRNTRINLTVVVPPRRLVLVEESGAEVRSYVGPVNEGDDLHLSCMAHGGRPAPAVTWLLNDQVIDDTIESREDDQTRNDLTLRGVTRSLLRAQLTCRATNNQVSPALATMVTIDMNLRPLDVVIHRPQEPLSAGRTYEVLCSSRGSRPPAVLTWWWGSSRMPAADDTTSHGGNVSTSIVCLTPNASDDGRLLACRAENRNVPTAVIEDTWKLSVYYAPTAKAVLGASLNPTNIREGDDVYFDCHVDANPRAYKVVWKHNGVVLRQEKEGGVLLNNMSLVVQQVTRGHAGRYTCQASNVEGDSTSTPVTLAVQYSPLCRPGQVKTYGVSKLEEAQVTCQVDAVPQVSRFYWTFNNTAESVDVPQERFSIGLGSRSVVKYTPMSDLDYGSLLCTAENIVGRQTVPCVFHIIPATQPESPTNCSLYNVSASSLAVTCDPGFDGGLNQTFAMEVYGTNPHSLKANITSKVPRFVVTGLDNESQFQLIVYAGNAKGRSGISRLVALTHKLPVKQLETRLGTSGSAGVSQDALAVEVTPLLGVLAGIILVLAVIAIVIIVILRVQCSAAARRRQAREQEGNKSDETQQRHQQKRSQQQQQQQHQFHKHQQPLGTLKKGRGSHIDRQAEVHDPNDDLHGCYSEQHLHQHHSDDQSPDVVACSGDCDEVSVSIRPGGALSYIPGHRHGAQHLQQLQHRHQQSPPLPQHSQQCQQQQHHLQQHSPSLGPHQSPTATQHSPDPHHYTLPLPGHGAHDLRHAHLLRQSAYSTTPRVCGGGDIEVHFSEGESGTPPAPAPDDVPAPLLYAGDVTQQVPVGTSLPRIPEDPESPTSARRESAV
nr:nephrin-like [Procambarus clarkii]